MKNVPKKESANKTLNVERLLMLKKVRFCFLFLEESRNQTGHQRKTLINTAQKKMRQKSNQTIYLQITEDNGKENSHFKAVFGGECEVK